MRESIGGSQVLLISVAILLIMIVVLSASIGYTKAFKARNAVINILQKYGAYDLGPNDVFSSYESDSYKELDQTLRNMGYMISAGTGKSCNRDFGDKYKIVGQEYQDRNYNFCVYLLEDEEGNQHYAVQTYMYFELPIFGKNDRFAFPIYGDTFTFFKYGI